MKGQATNLVNTSSTLSVGALELRQNCPASGNVGINRLLWRKCSCGNHTASGGECAECSKKKKLQKKLRIGAVNDPSEYEADRVADQVLRMPLGGETGKAPTNLQRLSHAGAGQESTVPDSVHQTLASSGRPLDANLSKDMGNRFGHDFSGVRVHQGSGAEQSARDVNAKAYTVGNSIVFGTGEYAPSSLSGRRLITHELAHVVQQTKSGKSLQRSPLFSSTIDICHRLLKSRVFHVNQSSVEVAIDGRWDGPSEGGASCEGHRSSNYNVILTQKNMFFDQEYGTCDFAPGELSTRSWSGLSPGDYYLVILTNNTNPYCCLSGTIDVEESKKNGGDSCTVIPDDALQILHTALDLAGLIPVLGAIPDGLNAGVYAIEGDWVGAGISVAAMVPIFGEGVTVTKLGVKFTRTAIKRLGKEGLEVGLKVAKNEGKMAAKIAEEALGKKAAKEMAEKSAAKKVGESSIGKEINEEAKQAEKGAAKEAGKKAAEKKIAESSAEKIAKCEEIYASYEILKSRCTSCKKTDSKEIRAAKIVCLTALLFGRKRYLEERCDYYLPGSLRRGSEIAERGHSIQAQQVEAMLLKCAGMSTT